MKRFVAVATFGAILLLSGCISMPEAGWQITGDWDWVLETAYQALEDNGYSNYYVSNFFVETLNREGFLDTRFLFPVWTIYLGNGELQYLRVRIHPDGDYFIEERSENYRPPKPFSSAYTSEDIRRWLSIASCAYHRLMGEFEDTCYDVYSRNNRYHEKITVKLLDIDANTVCVVTLDARTDEIKEIRRPWSWGR